jgi:hypothetical protein
MSRDQLVIYSGKQKTHNDIAAFLESYEDGQGREARFINAIFVYTSRNTGNENPFALLNNEEAKIFLGEIEKMATRYAKLLTEREDGKDSIFDLIMELMNIINNTHIDEEGELQPIITELKGGQTGGNAVAIGVFITVIVICFVSNVFLEFINPGWKGQIVDNAYSAVGNYRASMKDWMVKDKLKQDLDKDKIELNQNIFDLQEHARAIMDKEAELQSRQDTYMGMVANMFYSSEKERNALNQKEDKYARDMETVLGRIEKFKDKYIKAKKYKPAMEALDVILRHKNAHKVNVDTPDGLLHFMTLFGGLQGPFYENNPEKTMESLFLIYNNPNLFLRIFQPEGQSPYPVCAVEYLGADDKKDGSRRRSCVPFQLDNVPNALREKLTRKQIAYKFGDERTYQGQSQVKLTDLDKDNNLYALSKKTFSNILNKNLPAEYDAKTMDKVMDIVSEMDGEDIARVEQAIRSLNNNDFYRIGEGNELIINPDPTQKPMFMANLGTLDRTLGQVIGDIQRLSHPDRLSSNTKRLTVIRLKNFAKSDLRPGKNMQNQLDNLKLEDGETIDKFKERVLQLTMRTTSINSSYESIINVSKEDMRKVGDVGKILTEKLTGKNRIDLKESYMRSIFKEKAGDITIDRENIDRAIKEIHNSNEKVSSNELGGGRRATKKRRKRNTTRNKHKALRKTKSTHRKTTRRKRHEKKRVSKK